jgi:hypothetical protein
MSARDGQGTSTDQDIDNGRDRLMLCCSKFLALLLLLSPAIGFARGMPNGESPAFTPVPELSAGFDLLYEQKFAEGRQMFANWESRNREDPSDAM